MRARESAHHHPLLNTKHTLPTNYSLELLLLLLWYYFIFVLCIVLQSEFTFLLQIVSHDVRSESVNELNKALPYIYRTNETSNVKNDSIRQIIMPRVRTLGEADATAALQYRLFKRFCLRKRSRIHHTHKISTKYPHYFEHSNCTHNNLYFMRNIEMQSYYLFHCLFEQFVIKSH